LPLLPHVIFWLDPKNEAKKIKAARAELKNASFPLNRLKLASLKQQSVFNAPTARFSLRSFAEAGPSFLSFLHLSLLFFDSFLLVKGEEKGYVLLSLGKLVYNVMRRLALGGPSSPLIRCFAVLGLSALPIIV